VGQSDRARPPADDAVEHLQAAAGEMIAAARSFIDALEGVVHDRDAVSVVVDTFSSMAQAAAHAAGRVNPNHRDADGRREPGDRGEPDDHGGVQHIPVS
jgi:hypothetical protein